MFLKSLLKIPINISFKIFSWYAGIFILSSLIFFLFSYYYLTGTLKRQDRDEIILELNEVSSLYDIKGKDAIENFVTENYLTKRKKPLFIRIADGTNKTLHVFFPDYWKDFDLGKLGKFFPDNNQTWIQLPDDENRFIIEIRSKQISKDRWLQVGMSDEERKFISRHFRGHFTVVMVGLILLAFAGGIFLSSRILKPLRNIIQTVQSIEIGKMGARVARSNNRDELDELSRLFNKMLDRINHLINGMKDSLDNVAHDLRTPMTRIRNRSEIALQSDEDLGTYKDALISIIEETDHILKMMDTIMDIAEAEAGTLRIDRELTNLSSLIDRVVDMYEFVAEEKEVIISLNVPKDLFTAVDPERISQAIANLLDNAVKFTPSGGEVSFRARKTNDKITIEINDTGIGIRPQDLPRIWDRLYRADESRSQKGLGLGLSLVKAIIEAHNGSLEVQSEVGKGANFSVILPTTYMSPQIKQLEDPEHIS